jgi:hypothetical protein
MAIQFAIDESPVGIPCPTAYGKIRTFVGDRDKVTITLDTYADAAARKANNQPVATGIYVMQPVPLGGLFTAMYTFLKTLPIFSGALDC